MSSKAEKTDVCRTKIYIKGPVTYISLYQLSFYFRSLNVVLFLMTRRLDLPHHPQIVRIFYSIKKHVNIYVSINALLLAILIYRIEIYLLPTTCIIFYGFVGNLRRPLELLPISASYRQPLPTIANHCLLFPARKNSKNGGEKLHR